MFEQSLLHVMQVMQPPQGLGCPALGMEVAQGCCQHMYLLVQGPDGRGSRLRTITGQTIGIQPHAKA
ncbi:hypothetical protein, partial [uncultured Thiodictyon sp.]|uniref:hypothetical protein n=1 Tax=uncultured Thiodictyon sp. TaxID=1846217 RepID=UPI0025EC3470